MPGIQYVPVMDITDCQPDRIQNDPGDKPLGMSERDYRLGYLTETHSEWGCTIPWAPVASSIFLPGNTMYPGASATMLVRGYKPLNCETQDPSFIPLPLRGILSQQ